MRTIALTNKFAWASVDNEDYDRVRLFSWLVMSNGYVSHSFWRKNEKKRCFIPLHQFIIGRSIKKQDVIDHIDGDKLNNQKKNLRFVTASINTFNQHHAPYSSSGTKGVYWDEGHKSWLVIVRQNRKSKNLGRFKSKTAAIQRRKQFEIKGV